jgi:hypothetical protein
MVESWINEIISGMKLLKSIVITISMALSLWQGTQSGMMASSMRASQYQNCAT